MIEGGHTFARSGAPRLHVDDTGGGGLLVMFQHGLGGNAAQPAEVFPQGQNLRRITLECRGHGSSETGDATQFSIATFADDTVALIEELAVGPVVAGGISMGAAIAMRIAVKRPDLVRGLILARPAWSIAAAPANMVSNAEVGALLRSHPPDMARAMFAGSQTAKTLAVDGPDNLSTLMGFFRREPVDVTAALLSAIATDGPGVTRDELRAVKVPTLVIGHGMDVIHPLHMAEELAAIIPAARLVRITPKAEDRARYVTDMCAALTQFLKGHFA
jgi:pimeloyl-ACP methyl ester carboxylesterase